MFYTQNNMTEYNYSLPLNGSLPGISSSSLFTEKEIQALRVATIACNVVISLLSLIGNTSLLAVVYFNQRMRTNANYLIVNMAISDLLYIIFVIPLTLQQWIDFSMEYKILGAFGEIFCRLNPFVRDLSFTVSILSMVAISLDRYFAVVYPLRTKPFFLKTKIIVPFTWLIPVVTFGLYLDVYRLVGAFCVDVWPSKNSYQYFYLFVVGCFFILPFSIMTVLYSIIIHKIKRQEIPGNQTSEMENMRRKRNKSITKLGVFIITWFFISWAPYHTFMLLNILVWKGKLPAHLLKSIVLKIQPTCILLSITTVASNPCVCFACSTNFRKCFMRLMRCFRQRGRAESTLDYTRGTREGTINGRIKATIICRKSNEIGISNSALEDDGTEVSRKRRDTRL